MIDTIDIKTWLDLKMVLVFGKRSFILKEQKFENMKTIYIMNISC